jgi:HSP20 family protein
VAEECATPGAVSSVPVNVYANHGKLIVVAPMPGLEPENIVISIGGDTLAIHGERRGELQDGKDYLLHEWQVGPYLRAVKLPFPVDGTRANVTYNNGILTVAVPESDETVAHRIRLERISATRGEYHGFSGRSLRSPRVTEPQTTTAKR